MSELYHRVECEDNTVVDFFLRGHNVEAMEVFIFHSKGIDVSSLVGIVSILADQIIFEVFPASNVLRHYYDIGMETIKKVQKYPKIILG